MSTSPAIIYYSTKPSLEFSICFLILYTATSLLHLKRTIEFRRAVHVYLLIFSLLRTCLFAFRIAWSKNIDSEILGTVSNVLLSGGFFVIFEALLMLLSDWLTMLTETSSSTSTHNYQHSLITSLKLLSPSLSIVGVFGEILFELGTHVTLVPLLRQISSLGFLCLTIVYIILVTLFASKYGDRSIRKQLKALVLFISSALILIELVYRTFVSFISQSHAVNDYEWAFYVFECVPEIVLLVTLGGIILGEWFYNDDNGSNTTQQAKGAKGNFISSALIKKSIRRGEESAQEGGRTTEGEEEKETNSHSTVVDMNQHGKM